MGRTITQLQTGLTITNPNNESQAFMDQNATTQVTKDAQASNHPLDQLAMILRVPTTPKVLHPTAGAPDAMAMLTAAFGITPHDTVSHRNPFRTDLEDTSAQGLQVPQ